MWRKYLACANRPMLTLHLHLNTLAWYVTAVMDCLWTEPVCTGSFKHFYHWQGVMTDLWLISVPLDKTSITSVEKLRQTIEKTNLASSFMFSIPDLKVSFSRGVEVERIKWKPKRRNRENSIHIQYMRRVQQKQGRVFGVLLRSSPAAQVACGKISISTHFTLSRRQSLSQSFFLLNKLSHICRGAAIVMSVRWQKGLSETNAAASPATPGGDSGQSAHRFRRSLQTRHDDWKVRKAKCKEPV